MSPPSRKLEICTPPCGVTERPELEERPTNDNIRQKPPGRNLPNWHKRFSCARSAQSSLFRVSVCGTIWREGVEEIEEEEVSRKNSQTIRTQRTASEMCRNIRSGTSSSSSCAGTRLCGWVGPEQGWAIIMHGSVSRWIGIGTRTSGCTPGRSVAYKLKVN